MPTQTLNTNPAHFANGQITTNTWDDHGFTIYDWMRFVSAMLAALLMALIRIEMPATKSWPVACIMWLPGITAILAGKTYNEILH